MYRKNISRNKYMKLLKNELKNELNIRTENDYPIKGVEFIDIMPLFLQKENYHQQPLKSHLNMKKNMERIYWNYLS